MGAVGNRNLGIAHNISLQILKAKPVKGMSVRRCMKKCSRSEHYLKEVILLGSFLCVSPKYDTYKSFIIYNKIN